MKLNSLRTKQTKGFTLIEMIGVLAVIAILAAVLIPKVFEAINNSRINNACITCQTAKTGIADHYAKYGSLLSSNGVTIATTDVGAQAFDRTLVQEGFLDKLFAVKISAVTAGVSNHVELVAAQAANVAPSAGAGNGAYALAANTANNDATGSAVAQAVIPGVTENDAKDLNDRIDGPAMGTAIGNSDFNGRVKYATAGAGGGTTTVYVYLTHR